MKVVALLNRLKTAYTKFIYLLGKWDSMAKSGYYLHSEFLPWKTMMPGYHYVIYHLLVKKEKIILPAFNIKLGLMKQFAKALKQTKSCF